MEKRLKKGSRSGFTMIELMIALVIAALVAALIIPRIMSNARQASMTSTVQADIRNIAVAAGQWKTQSSDSDGTFNNITVKELCPYLPSNMACDDTYIYSSGYKGSDKKGMIKYKILSYKKNTNGDSFKIFMDGSDLASAQSWGSRAKTTLETKFDNICKKLSSDSNVTIDTEATDIGDANAGFTDGGTSDDAESGVAGITQ